MTPSDIRKLADDPCIRECCPQAPDVLRACADVVGALNYSRQPVEQHVRLALARLEAIK